MIVEKPKYGTKRAGMVYYMKILQRDILDAFFESNAAFPEMFEDYERYHSKVQTGRPLRAQLIEDWVEKGSHILDVGVGDGIVSDYLKKRLGAKIDGMDISDIACRKARGLGIETKIRDINNGLGLGPKEVYDYILLIEVIEHALYPSRLLIDAVTHARKAVIVTIPNSAYIKWRIQLLRGYAPRQSFTHLHFWSIKDFELFCKVLNIRVIAFRTFLPRLTFKLRNLLAYQQCWLLAPCKGP